MSELNTVIDEPTFMRNVYGLARAVGLMLDCATYLDRHEMDSLQVVKLQITEWTRMLDPLSDKDMQELLRLNSVLDLMATKIAVRKVVDR